MGEPRLLTRVIPSSGEALPAVGLGTWQTFDAGRTEKERRPLEEVLRRFVELGGRAVDSSPMYGRAESVLGEISEKLGVQGSLFFATKVWTRGREAGTRQMEESLRRLRVSRIDLMQVHNLVDAATHLPVLAEWKRQDRVRYIGITHYTAAAYAELERWLSRERLDFLQINYSLFEREAEERLLPLAAERGVAVLANRPFGGGEALRRAAGKPLPAWAKDFDCDSWAQFFLKWILSNPAVTCAIPATAKPGNLEDNMRAGAGRLPDAKERARMVAVAAAL